MQDYKKLKVWEVSHQLTILIYNETKYFPREELFSLTSQLRRASYSITLNLVEGCGRFTQADKVNFFQISFASSQELEYTLFLCKELGYLTNENFDVLNVKVIEVKQMLNALIKTIRASYSKKS